MDNRSRAATAVGDPLGAPRDLQEHIARLEAKGLLTRIQRPINKDTELHPLARWQFQGGLDEDQRRAFLFTNVVDGEGHAYDIPVLIGGLAASPEIYATGLGLPVEQIGKIWMEAIAEPIPPVEAKQAPCHEVVITGDALKEHGLSRLPVPVSTPGFDAAPYLTATLCVTKDPESGVQNMGTYRAALKAEDRLGVRMASRLSGAGGYLHWEKYHAKGQQMPCAIVLGCAPAVLFTGPQKLQIDQDEMAVAGGLMRAPVDVVRCKTIDLVVPADAEIVIEGLIDTDALEPEGPFGESHGHVALEDYNMSMHVTAITMRRKPVFVSIVSQVTPSESSVLQAGRPGAAVSRTSAEDAGRAGRETRGDARAAHQPAQSHLRPVCARHAAGRGLARHAGRRDVAGAMRQARHRGIRGYRSDQRRRDLLVAGLSFGFHPRSARVAFSNQRSRPEIRQIAAGEHAADRCDAQA